MLKNNITMLNEFEGSALLKQGGIPVIDGILAHDYPEAAKAANLLGFPVALKICSENVPHKTERGGVALNITDASSLERAVREMSNKFSDVPHALLVQKMARPGTELILGVRRDPVFGPVVLVGIGGIFTEIFRDTAIDLAPVDSTVALACSGASEAQPFSMATALKSPWILSPSPMPFRHSLDSYPDVRTFSKSM